MLELRITQTDIAGVAYLTVLFRTVSACYLYTIMSCNCGLSAVRHEGKSFPRKTQYVHEIIAEVYPVAAQKVVVQEIYIKIYVVSHKDIISCELIEIHYRSLYFRSIFHHFIGNSRKLGNKRRYSAVRSNESIENSCFLAVPVPHGSYFDYLALPRRKPCSLDIDNAVIFGKCYPAFAFFPLYAAHTKAPSCLVIACLSDHSGHYTPNESYHRHTLL